MFTSVREKDKKAEAILKANLKKYLIPLEEIKRATKNFSSDSQIGDGLFCKVYKGQLSERWQNRTAAIKRLDDNMYLGMKQFLEEVELFSKFHHENIIPFIGYCKKNRVLVIVHEYATNGSLDGHLENIYTRRCITWSQRLKICLGAAKGLNHLHSGHGDGKSTLHRHFKSPNILLDDNLEAKICDFGFSRLSATMHHFTIPETRTMGDVHLDPIYYETGSFGKETDVYSYGLVLFEMLSGMLVHHERNVGDHDVPQNLINLVRSHYDDGLDKLIDSCITTQIDRRSFETFKEIAYKCISYNLEDRPTMAIIIERIEKALDIQNHGEVSSTITIRSRIYQNLEHFLIPLKEINLATRNFSKFNQIGDGGFSVVYKGKLSEHWHNCTAAIKRFGLNGYKGEDEFYNELEIISSFHHKNIIPFIGYCVEGNEMITVYKYAVNGSLDQHLQNPWKIRQITWAQRLNICLGAARGLSYLHSGHREHKRVVHRHVKSSKILLDDRLEATICGFSWSILVPGNQSKVYTYAPRTRYSIDALYNESQIPSTELDVYSFGVVMFEMLSGMLVFHEKSIGDDKPENLINLIRRHYDDGPQKLIDPHIKYYIDQRSFHKFIEIAHKCISFNLKDRPTMDRIIKKIEEVLDCQKHTAVSNTIVQTHQYRHLEKFIIPLEEIEVAIGVKNRKSLIGDGGFGTVYKGQLSEQWQNRTAAIKLHDPKGYQGKDEFLNELEMLSRFHHDNIIPFIGYYYSEGNEMIIVSEYATNGSLDYYLREKRHSLKWIQRLKICLGAAKGLNYLHSGLGDDSRVVHRDIKSANILLDDNLEAKICDFGLSRSGPRNQPKTQIYTKAAGTNFYMDPIYRESGILRKESDVYSFGVVLFEMLSGMLAYYGRKIGTDKPETLIGLVRRLYDEGQLDNLIDPVIKDQLDPRSLYMFKNIAHECISYNIKERPTMETVVARIEDALKYQLSQTRRN